MTNIANTQLNGYIPTIGDYISQDALPDLNYIRDEFANEDGVDSDFIKEILSRDSRERNTVFCDEKVLASLVKNEDDIDHSQLKEALMCFGDFPEYEKKFLKNILEMEISKKFSEEEKFKYLEEGLCTINKEYLMQYMIEDSGGIQKNLNSAIINACLDSNPNPAQKIIKFNNPAIKEAVEVILTANKEDLDDLNPFTGEEDDYKLGAHDLKKTFQHCYRSGSIAQRLCTLKGLLQGAIQQNDKLFLFKFVCTHSSKDLSDVLHSFTVDQIKLVKTEEDDKPGVDLSLLSCGTSKKELLDAMKIKGTNLRKLIDVSTTCWERD